MIIYFVTRGYEHTIEAFLNEWSPATGERFMIVAYEDIESISSLPAGAVIFSDIERLGPRERRIAGTMREAFATQNPGVPILNDPERTMRRYELLTTLADQGLNPFRAHRLVDTTRPDRFPVFLRSENEHTGSASGVLATQDELDRAIVRAIIHGFDVDDLLIVEFLDTSDDHGVFSKHAAAVIGSRIIPQHVMYSDNWVVKGVESIENVEQEELDYLRANPHESELAAISELAAVDYGRIDYTVVDDGVVTWEINTNPYIAYTRSDEPTSTVARFDIILSAMEDAFAAIDPGPTDRRVDVSDIRWTEPTRRNLHPIWRSVVSRSRRHRRALAPLGRAADWVAVALRRPILAMWRRKHGITD